MKKTSIFKTRRQYYVAHIIGVVVLLAICGWCTFLAFNDNDFDLVPLIIAVLSLVVLLQAMISFFSSMKLVEVTSKEVIISYIFQRHQNVIQFSEVKEIKSKVGKSVTTRITDNFTLVLHDGRVFTFGRSQFDQYGKLKEACKKKANS